MKEITINDKLKKIHDNGFKIFPKFNMNFKFAVAIEDANNIIYKKKITVGEYQHTNKTINKAIEIALNHVYSKLNVKI